MTPTRTRALLAVLLAIGIAAGGCRKRARAEYDGAGTPRPPPYDAQPPALADGSVTSTSMPVPTGPPVATRSWKTECNFLDRPIAPGSFTDRQDQKIDLCRAPEAEVPQSYVCPSIEKILIAVDARAEAQPGWTWLLTQPRWPVVSCSEKKGPLHAQYPRYTESVQALGTAEYQGKLHDTAICGSRSCPHMPGGETLDKRAPVLRALDAVFEQMGKGHIDLAFFAFDGVSDEPMDPTRLPRKARFGRLVQSLRRFAEKNMGVFTVASPATYQYLYLLSSEAATPYARALAPLVRETFEDALVARGQRALPFAMEIAPGPRSDARARWNAAQPTLRFAAPFGEGGLSNVETPPGLVQLAWANGRFSAREGPRGELLPPHAGLNILPWLDASRGRANRWAVAIDWTRQRAPTAGSVQSPVVQPPPVLHMNQAHVLRGWGPGAAIESVDTLTSRAEKDLPATLGLSGVRSMGDGCSAAPTGLDAAGGVHGRVYPLLGLTHDPGKRTSSLFIQMAHVPDRKPPGWTLAASLFEPDRAGDGAADGGSDPTPSSAPDAGSPGTQAEWKRRVADEMRDNFAHLPQVALISPSVELDPCFAAIADGVDLFWTSNEVPKHHPSCNDSPLRGLEMEMERTSPSAFAWTGYRRRVGASTLVDLIRELYTMDHSSAQACILASLRVMSERDTGQGKGGGSAR